MNIALFNIILSIFTWNVSAKTMSQMVAEAVKELKGNTADITTLKQHVKILEIIHDVCMPCKGVKGSSLCDCTTLDPKQDCLSFRQSGLTHNGLYRLKKDGFDFSTVYCDQETMGGGWTVIQRRQDGSVDFNRKWHDYKVGFGKLFGEMWIGNDNIHELTKASKAPKKSELLVTMRMKGQSKMVYAKYDIFMVGDEASKYLLTISGPSGNATTTSSMLYYNNKRFTTKDADNDNYSANCASKYSGGWWFNSCWVQAHLNGIYKFVQTSDAIFWNWSSKIQPEFVEMKIRRKI